MKNIYYLQPSSFCFGVQKSIDELEKIIKNNSKKKIYCIHELVHNPRITNHLKNLWVNFVQSIYDVHDQNAIIIFSAHGTNRSLISQTEKKFKHVYNLECPFVTKVYKEVDTYIKNWVTTFFYIGKHNHQEGKNIIDYIFSKDVNIYVFDNKKNIPKIDKSEKIGILSQTTLNYQETKKLFDVIKSMYPDAIFPEPSDICKATFERQEVILQNIDKFETLIIIGWKESNNGKELYRLWIKYKKKTFYGESLADILQYPKKELFSNERVAITWWASTPMEDIREVFDYYKKNGYQPNILDLN